MRRINTRWHRKTCSKSNQLHSLAIAHNVGKSVEDCLRWSLSTLVNISTQLELVPKSLTYMDFFETVNHNDQVSSVVQGLLESFGQGFPQVVLVDLDVTRHSAMLVGSSDGMVCLHITDAKIEDLGEQRLEDGDWRGGSVCIGGYTGLVD